jgi:hypothetical protein
MDQGEKQDNGRDGSPVQQDKGPPPFQEVHEEQQQLYELDTIQSPRHFQPSPPSPQPEAALQEPAPTEEGAVGRNPHMMDGINIEMWRIPHSDKNDNITVSSSPIPTPPQLNFDDHYNRTPTALQPVASRYPPHSSIHAEHIKPALGPPMENLYVEPPPQKATDLSHSTVNLQCDESFPQSSTSSTTDTASNPEAPTPPSSICTSGTTETGSNTEAHTSPQSINSSSTDIPSNIEGPSPPSSIYTSGTNDTASEGPTTSPSPEPEPVVHEAQIYDLLDALVDAHAESLFDADIDDHIYAQVVAEILAQIYALVEAIIFDH